MIGEKLVVHEWKPKCIRNDDHNALGGFGCRRIGDIGLEAADGLDLAGGFPPANFSFEAIGARHGRSCGGG